MGCRGAAEPAADGAHSHAVLRRAVRVRADAEVPEHCVHVHVLHGMRAEDHRFWGAGRCLGSLFAFWWSALWLPLCEGPFRDSERGAGNSPSPQSKCGIARARRKGLLLCSQLPELCPSPAPGDRRGHVPPLWTDSSRFCTCADPQVFAYQPGRPTCPSAPFSMRTLPATPLLASALLASGTNCSFPL